MSEYTVYYLHYITNLKKIFHLLVVTCIDMTTVAAQNYKKLMKNRVLSGSYYN